MPTTVVEEPGELMKTRIMMVSDEDDDLEELGKLDSYDKVAAKSLELTHGQIRAMRNWSIVQGGTPPWRLKRLFGVIPLPWVSVAAILVLIIAAAQGLDLSWAVIIFLMLFISTIAAGYWLAEYKFDATGICIIGGEPVGKKWKKSVTVTNHRGQQKQVAQGGYCDEHAWTVHRASLWTAVEAQVWRGIISTPIRKPTFLRRIGYALFWWVGYHEEFIDPRPAGQGIIYRRRDRTKPREQLNENVIESTMQLLFMAAANLERLRKARRKM